MDWPKVVDERDRGWNEYNRNASGLNGISFFVDLQAPKTTPEQLADVASSCFKLNSLQLQALLERYRPAPDEPPLPPQLIAAIVRVVSAVF